MKGQISIEYLASFFLYLFAIIAVFQYVSGDIPEFNESLDQKRLHSEAKYVSDQVIKQGGYHTKGSGGTNWEKNLSTKRSLETFGLAKEYKVIDHDKLGNISTVGTSKVNYTQFREAIGIDNQYYLNFTWTPIVDLNQGFDRENSPTQITIPTHDLYGRSDPEVKYGNITLNGQTKHFLATSHQGRYNTTWTSNNQNFQNTQPKGTEIRIDIGGKDFEITDFQNLRYDKGSMIFLQAHIKGFGSSIDESKELVKFNRYVSYERPDSELMPMRMEVYTW